MVYYYGWAFRLQKNIQTIHTHTIHSIKRKTYANIVGFTRAGKENIVKSLNEFTYIAKLLEFIYTENYALLEKKSKGKFPFGNEESKKQLENLFI